MAGRMAGSCGSWTPMPLERPTAAWRIIFYRCGRFSQSNPWPGQWIAACRKELSEETDGDRGRSWKNAEWMRFLVRDVKRQAERVCRAGCAEALETRRRRRTVPRRMSRCSQEDLRAMEAAFGGRNV